MFYILPFWIELKPSGASRSPLIVRVDPNLVHVEEQAPSKANARRFRRHGGYSRADRNFRLERLFLTHPENRMSRHTIGRPIFDHGARKNIDNNLFSHG